MADYDAEYPSGFFGCFFPTNRFTKRILHVSDILMTAFVVTPLVVAHWWGSFAFMDRHAEYFPLWPTLAFGLSWHLLMALTRHHIHATVKRPEHVPKSLLRSVGSFLFTKGYIYVFSVSGILSWRAIFNLMQQFGMLQDIFGFQPCLRMTFLIYLLYIRFVFGCIHCRWYNAEWVHNVGSIRNDGSLCEGCHKSSWAAVCHRRRFEREFLRVSNTI